MVQRAVKWSFHRGAPALGALIFLLACAGASAASSQPLARSPDPAAPVYVVAHVDVTTEHTDEAIRAIRTYVEAARREPGVIRIDAIEELRPNHFDLLEVWRDQAAYEAHTAKPATIRFQDTIHPWRGSPFEARLGSAITP